MVLATIGNLMPPKNYPLLIEVVRLLRARGVPLKVVVYGGGPLRVELEARRKAAGLDLDLLFCGQDPEARVLIRAADIFGFTSREEGMANALLEGAWAGLPIVTTAVGGTGDIVLGGETGFVVPVNDSAAFAQAVETLVTRTATGEGARRRVLEEFGDTRMVERFHDVYERVLPRTVPTLAAS